MDATMARDAGARCIFLLLIREAHMLGIPWNIMGFLSFRWVQSLKHGQVHTSAELSMFSFAPASASQISTPQGFRIVVTSIRFEPYIRSFTLPHTAFFIEALKEDAPMASTAHFGLRNGKQSPKIPDLRVTR